MNYKPTIGVHLRLQDSLTNLIHQALALELSIFQFFLVKQKSNKYVPLLAKDKEEFLKIRRASFKELFIHSSYWINPAANSKETYSISRMLLNKELRIAQALEVEYLVLHAGSAKGHLSSPTDPNGKMRGIDTLAKMLNNILKKTSSTKILLENSAHGKKTIGNDLYDFVIVREKLDYPEKIGFCIDTAHAFSYGYNLEPVDEFVTLIDKVLGLEYVKLIHFNDTYDAYGSMQDRHAFPGQGKIGKSTLQKILHYPLLSTIPKIIETPDWSLQTTHQALNDLVVW